MRSPRTSRSSRGWCAVPEKLTRSQAARIAALSLAHQMTPEQRSERARKGGNATREAHGTVHYVRMAHRSHGWQGTK